jgi:hypothetical protein
LVVLYAMAGALVLPWVVWHLAVGGISGIYLYPNGWLATEYGSYINDFWGRGYRESLPAYLSDSFETIPGYLLPGWLWPVAGLGIVAIWKRYGWRAVLFGAGLVLTLGLPVIVTRAPIFPRYWYGLLPVLALLVAAGSAFVVDRAPRLIAMGAILALLGAGLGTAVIERDDAYDRTVTREATTQADLEHFAAIIDDDRGIIGRDARMQALVPENRLYNNLLLSKDEFITYLAWQSDASVSALFSEHDIGWVIIYNNAARWEVSYNAWMAEAAGQMPAHYDKIKSSTLVEAVYPGEVMTLYQLKGP